MRQSRFVLGSTLLWLGSLWLATAVQAAGPAPRPNIVLLVVDDMGYSDLGAMGGEIDTPNLDALLREGRLLSSMLVAPTCSPTRAMLLSGMDNHLAGVGNMAEMMTPTLTPHQMGQAGYEGYLASRVVALPQLLREAGYHTYMSGKWHLGMADGQRPERRGFERSFALMNGGAAHFNQSAPQQIMAGTPAPTYREDGRVVSLPTDFYSSTFFTDKLISYLDTQPADGQPFFAYLAYTAPHLPLQAPDRFLRQYRGRYAAGYEEVARQRIARMQRLGLIGKQVKPVPMPPGVRPWASLSPAEQARSARDMEAYAAMLSALDAEVGRLVAHLKQRGQFDNTVILFLSDNGPEGNDWAADGGNKSWIPANFDNRLENIGRPDSFAFQGPAWGQVSAQPFRYFKAFTNEGGVRSASFIRYPSSIRAGRSTQLLTAMDVMPTLLELAGAHHPGLLWQGQTVLPVQGMSMLPYLQGRAAVHNPDYVWGMELMGRQALRKGYWKIVYHYQNRSQGRWALYDLQQDPGEQHDVASRHAAKLDELLTEWAQYVQRNNVRLGTRDTGYPLTGDE